MDVSLFGALYRQERTRKNLTMDDITQKTGITKAFLSMLENGKVADIKLSNIEKLVGAIDYSPVQFLTLLERVEENGVFKKKTAIIFVSSRARVKVATLRRGKKTPEIG